jgi:hypothetical protein
MPEMIEMIEITDMTDCQSSTGADPVAVLPTRQKNALRLLLDKPVITPEEVATLDYRTIKRAPGIGKHSLSIIRAEGAVTAQITNRSMAMQKPRIS